MQEKNIRFGKTCKMLFTIELIDTVKYSTDKSLVRNRFAKNDSSLFDFLATSVC
jgi:hypothetical protein